MKQKEKRTTPLHKKLNGKRVPVCDYKGNCINKAYREVYPMLMRKIGWSYLCRKHFEQEKKRLKGKLPYCTLD